MWNTLREIRKFTPKAEVDRILGVSPVQIEDRPAWYYGGGFVLHYSPVRFRVEGIQRVEYGGPGEYVVGGWHFPDAGTLKLELGLTCFDAADAAPLEEDIVDGVITYQSTFQEIHRCAAQCSLEYYSEGETRRQVEGGMAFLKRWIAWEQYEFYFYSKSRRTKVSGFRFTLPE